MNSKIKEIQEAYDEASGNWAGCDWAEPRSCWVHPKGHILHDSQVDDRAIHEEDLVHVEIDLDGITAGEARERVRVHNAEADLWEEAAEWLGACEGAAAQAEEYALEAIEHAREGRWGKAIAQAEMACSVESEYGDCPTWRPFREALEEAFDTE